MRPEMAAAGGGWATMRTFQRDRSVTKAKLRPGTLRRIVAFARPYRRMLAVFLLLIVLDAALATALPLIFKAIIDDGVVAGRVGLVEALAGVVAAIAVVDAV